MDTLSILVQLEAKPGKEDEVEKFLKSALPLVQAETGTTTWYALKMGPSKFGIFDTFADEKGRNAHLGGEVAKAVKIRLAVKHERPGHGAFDEDPGTARQLIGPHYGLDDIDAVERAVAIGVLRIDPGGAGGAAFGVGFGKDDGERFELRVGGDEAETFVGVG